MVLRVFCWLCSQYVRRETVENHFHYQLHQLLAVLPSRIFKFGHLTMVCWNTKWESGIIDVEHR